MNVLLVYPEFPDTFWSFKYAMKFINKAAANPPLGLITVAAMLPSSWNIKLVDLNLRRIKKEDWNWSDLVMISAMTVQRKSANELIVACKQNGKTVVAGGPLFTEEYQTFPEVDHFVLNEAEITLSEFLRDFENKQCKRVYTTDKYPDIKSSPIPRYDLLELNRYDAMSIQYSRGCPFNCDFCNVTALFGHAPRVKSTTQVLAELDALYSAGWRRNIFFVDDNFIGNKRHIKNEVLPALIEWRKGKTGCLFITEVSINMADDPELLSLMASAGFVSVFIGIETPSEDGLVECHKTQNTKRDLIASVHRIQQNGIQVMAGFIIGFDTDKTSIFQSQFDFIQESGIITAMVGLLQAPHGTKLYDRMKADGRLIEEMTGDNADGTTNIRTIIEPQVLSRGYQNLMKELYAPKTFYLRINTFLSHFKPSKAPVTIHLTEIEAFLKTIWFMGITGKDRFQYWALLFKVITRMPEKFPIAVTLTVYGYHFRRVADLHLKGVWEKETPLINVKTPQKRSSFEKVRI